jgi:hypothetical protein
MSHHQLVTRYCILAISTNVGCERNVDLTPILPTGSDGCVYNSVPVQLKVQIVRYERVQAGLSITVPHGG